MVDAKDLVRVVDENYPNLCPNYYNRDKKFIIIGSVKHHDAQVDFQDYLGKCVIIGVKYIFQANIC
jgi:Zn-dependent alcohol dehydrogenase